MVLLMEGEVGKSNDEMEEIGFMANKWSADHLAQYTRY